MLYMPGSCRPKVPKYFQELIDTEHRVVAEPKIDGSRYLLYIGHDPYDKESKNTTLLSRRISTVTDRFLDKADNVPHITQDIPSNMNGTVLDGEIHLPGDSSIGMGLFLGSAGIMNSHSDVAIQKQLELGLLRYTVFDILQYNGKNVTAEPYSCRRQRLKDVVETLEHDYIHLIPQYDKAFKAEYQCIIDEGGEGIVLKGTDAAYGTHWYKWKKRNSVSTIITGFTAGTGKYEGQIGAVKVSVFKDGTAEFIEVGQVSGMDDATRKQITQRMDEYVGRVLDVFAQELTPGDPIGRLRHPSWDCLRDEISVIDVTMAKLLQDI